jgi:hypothetical protein
MKSCLRVVFRLKTELLLAAFGAAVGVHLVRIDAPGLSALGAMLAGAGIAAGAAVLTRSGELALAWNCPRLDALGLRTDSRRLPWPILRAADAALGALDDGKAYRSFFPEARADLLRSACRVIDAHRLRTRAEKALREAPPGVARQHLEQQVARADAELAELSRLLLEVRARFIASTNPMPSVEDPAPSLRALEERTGALGEAIDELQRGTARPPVRIGGSR